MHGISTYIYHKKQPNVGKNAMDPMGKWKQDPATNFAKTSQHCKAGDLHV